MSAHIRCYQPADREALLALWREVLPDSAPHNDPVTALDNKLAAADDLLLVAVQDDSVIGTIMGGYDGHRGWMYSLAVHPNARRQRIGTALVQALEQHLAARGCLKLNLQVRVDNAAVVAFYEHLGFTVEPRLSMGKKL